jgi:uncharacterized SAM-binding protein YcdF (DUF218 family)
VARKFLNVRRTLGLLLVASAGLAAVAWHGRAALLQGAAEAWIVSDPVTQSDAVAVFGGGLEVRPFAAARYYRERLAAKVLVAEVRPGPSTLIGVVPSHADLNRAVLVKLGVPAQAIETFGEGVTSTKEEALALRHWAERAGAVRIIVPTGLFSARRVRWMLQKAFAGSGISIDVPALDDPDYTSADWWLHEQGLISFQNEVIKYAYYRFKY